MWLDGGPSQATAIQARRRCVPRRRSKRARRRLLAATTARAVAAAPHNAGGTAGAGAREPERQAVDGGLPPDPLSAVQHVSGDEGRWGSREVEITEVAFLDARRSAVVRLPLAATPMSVRVKVRATQPVDDFVFGIGLFNADGVCCYGTNTYHRRDDARSGSLATPRSTFADRQPRSRRGHLQARRRGPQRDGVSLRLPPAALHLPREISHARRRHLSSASPLDVLGVRDSSRPSRERTLTPRRLVAPPASAGTSDHRLHQRRLRSPASRPRPLSAAGARSGDALIVGVNSDRSVRANKGPAGRSTPKASAPRCSPRWRVVDTVVIFDEDTPHDLIAALQPDVLVKGADWAEDAIVGRDIVEAHGGRVVRVPIEQGTRPPRSSSASDYETHSNRPARRGRSHAAA